jgi:hypothetical protein
MRPKTFSKLGRLNLTAVLKAPMSFGVPYGLLLLKEVSYSLLTFTGNISLGLLSFVP